MNDGDHESTVTADFYAILNSRKEVNNLNTSKIGACCISASLSTHKLICSYTF